jgi:hypothetical protein
MRAIPPDAVKFTKFSFFQSLEADAKAPTRSRHGAGWGRTCEPEQRLNRRVAPRAECRRRRVAMDREASGGSEHRRAPLTGALGLLGGGRTALWAYLTQRSSDQGAMHVDDRTVNRGKGTAQHGVQPVDPV